MKVSIGICAYNEQANIDKLLTKLVGEPLLSEIIVVASGCTDRTVPIALSFKGIKVLTQEQRRGKASAVNLFIKEASGDVLILESADTLPSQFCFKHLLKPFEDEKVGMAGAHPIPVNSRKTMMGRIAHLIWESHHQSALTVPKAGEVVAFRNVVSSIDPKTPVDEASVEQKIAEQGYRIVYAPKAIVFNKAPETVEDFMRQRKRIYHGHLILQREGYTVPTMGLLQVLRATIKASRWDWITLVTGAVLEAHTRRKAKREFSVNSSQPTVWEISKTTKEVK